MAKSRNNKSIQVPMEEELLKQIDATAGKELDRLYIEGHQSHPEDLDWAESSAKLLSKRLPKEKW